MAAAGMDGCFAQTEAAVAAAANASATVAAATAAATAAKIATTKNDLTAGNTRSFMFLREGRAMSEPALSPAAGASAGIGAGAGAQTPRLTFGRRSSQELSPLRLDGEAEQKTRQVGSQLKHLNAPPLAPAPFDGP